MSKHLSIKHSTEGAYQVIYEGESVNKSQMEVKQL
jgi:hypothetical protein